jgi:hypothetical protein
MTAPSAAAGYSNTVGNATGNLSYWTIDGGYDFVRGPGMKVGAFVGYNEYHDNKSSFTCSENAQLKTERYGLLLQAAYKFPPKNLPAQSDSPPGKSTG